MFIDRKARPSSAPPNGAGGVRFPTYKHLTPSGVKLTPSGVKTPAFIFRAIHTDPAVPTGQHSTSQGALESKSSSLPEELSLQWLDATVPCCPYLVRTVG